MSDIAKSLDRFNKYLKNALTYINAHFFDPDMNLKTVAETVALSPSHFSTIFSQSLGKTFIEYLTDQRINYAKNLLVTTDSKLTSITLEIGYSDSNYFSYLFKKKEGMSPSEYRKRGIVASLV